MAGVRGASALVLISLGVCRAVDYEAMWADFKVKYDKVHYDSDVVARFQAFVANVDYINAENAKNHSFTRGLNAFSDMTFEELLPMLSGARRADSSEPDSGDKRSPYLGRHVRGAERLPDSVDWTTKGAVAPVKDQKICGSCWAFSGTAALEGAGAIASGKLVSLSEQQNMQCSQGAVPGHGCQGGWPWRVFEYAVDNDLCTEASYPYQGVDTIPCFWNVNPPKCSEVGLSKDLVSGYKKVTPSSEEDLMSALAQQPVSIDVRTDGWLSYSGGIYTGCRTASGIEHAVLAVGYTTEFWKVKNSWGSSWGEGGYIRLPRGVAGLGACNLLTEPSYPVVAAEVVV